MTPIYRRTQTNNFLIAIFGLAILVTLIVAFFTRWWVPAGLTLLLLSASLLVFHSMTVEVDAEQVRLYFGIGWPRRAVPLGEIRDVCIVQHMPGEGWGIRKFRGGLGTIYRIAGEELVELDLTESRTLRIGCEDPLRLATVIEDTLIERRKKR